MEQLINDIKNLSLDETRIMNMESLKSCLTDIDVNINLSWNCYKKLQQTIDYIRERKYRILHINKYKNEYIEIDTINLENPNISFQVRVNNENFDNNVRLRIVK